MNFETIHKLSKEYMEQGLYRGSFERLSVASYRQIDYANNVLLVESDEDIEDEALVIFSVFEEAPRCLYWSTDRVNKFISAIKISVFPTQEFLALYKTHFRGNKIFERIDTTHIDTVYSFSNPAYNDWCGEFFVKAGGKSYVLMWDYCD